MNSPEYMLIGEKMIEAKVLDRPAKSPDSDGISSRLGLRVRDANLHELQCLTGGLECPEVTLQ
jgi:hypothetical protein